ncbi:hypothetical protein ACFU53_13045 [Streptomyces sp. NPDC057474]|uniref:hypothetical protein n=1 Tax=Streptomyces sp. NPDC057474 TaxID=3346144 RepID=UPI003693A5DB
MRDANGTDGMSGMGGTDGTNGTNGTGGTDGTNGMDGMDGKANRHMTQGDSTHGDLTASTAVERDIAFLLADAADEVEIGIAPYQAVVRGGRRRKTRRWVVAAAAAVVIAGTTGTLALAGVTDGDRGWVAPAATPTASVAPETRHMYEPWRTTLAEGRDQGTDWKVTIEVWDAPRSSAQADKQLAAMGLFGVEPRGAGGAAGLVGKSWHFVHLTVGDDRTSALIDGEDDAMSGTDLEAFATVLRAGDRDEDGDPERLVIGRVAPTAQQVRIAWSDGTSVDVNRDGDDIRYEDLRNPRIVDVEGARTSWFVALAPEGVGYESAKVTK